MIPGVIELLLLKKDKMVILAKLAAAVGLFAAAANATFTLVNPPALPGGTNQLTAPCGGADLSGDLSFTEWPANGLDLLANNITESRTNFFYVNVALREDPTEFVELYSTVQGNDSGVLCISRMHGWTDEKWLGKEAIFQLVLYVGNGVMDYQVGPTCPFSFYPPWICCVGMLALRFYPGTPYGEQS